MRPTEELGVINTLPWPQYLQHTFQNPPLNSSLKQTWRMGTSDADMLWHLGFWLCHYKLQILSFAFGLVDEISTPEHLRVYKRLKLEMARHSDLSCVFSSIIRSVKAKAFCVYKYPQDILHLVRARTTLTANTLQRGFLNDTVNEIFISTCTYNHNSPLAIRGVSEICWGYVSQLRAILKEWRVEPRRDWGEISGFVSIYQVLVGIQTRVSVSKIPSEVQTLSWKGNTWVKCTYSDAGVLFKDLRFLVGGLELLSILETNSGCLFLLRSSTLHLSVWLVANLALRESVPQRHAPRFWHY